LSCFRQVVVETGPIELKNQIPQKSKSGEKLKIFQRRNFFVSRRACLCPIVDLAIVCSPMYKNGMNFSKNLQHARKIALSEICFVFTQILIFDAN